ncbi:hypothetical protein CEXT_339061 [Caerostris extrusa]|uniref:Uncharacterized protein n=1 Tax=Caerostris extrusa TaxID=172846 RepID=A0AAV4VDA0_CAEEX|nr:hypothetical protein CEXT_339061 [Caerostris extrusa]
MAKSLSKSTLTDSVKKWPFKAKERKEQHSSLIPNAKKRKSHGSHICRGLLPSIKESALYDYCWRSHRYDSQSIQAVWSLSVLHDDQHGCMAAFVFLERRHLLEGDALSSEQHST